MGRLKLRSRHRLLCGDSTKAEDVARLMDGEKADLCFTSPPYALGSSVALSGNRTMSERGNAYEGHEDTPEGWPDLMAGWWDAFDGVATCSVVNVQPLAGNKRDLMRWIADRSDRLVDIAIWNKIAGEPQMASGVLTSIFEFLVKQAPPPGTFQAAIDRLPGARSKKLDGMRRVLGIVIETDRDQVIKLLRRDELALVLKEEHAEALETDEAARGLAQQVVSILGLEKNRKHAHKQARQPRSTGWYL